MSIDLEKQDMGMKTTGAIQATSSRLMPVVFNWMAAGLGLTGAVALRVNDLEGGILSLALNDKPVRERAAEHRFRKCAVTLGIARLILIAAEQPADCIQYRGLTLIVIAADDGETVCGRRKLHRTDALDIFQFECIDFDRHIHHPFIA